MGVPLWRNLRLDITLWLGAMGMFKQSVPTGKWDRMLLLQRILRSSTRWSIVRVEEG